MLLFEVLRKFRVRHQVKPHQLHGAFPVVVRLPISSLSGGRRQSSHYFPGSLSGFSGPVVGLGSGFGAARVGAGPVITSKSKLPRCMGGLLWWWTKGRSIFSGFRYDAWKIRK